MDRAGAVAGLALHVAERIVVREVRAALLVPARDVAADAVEVELLATIDERLPRARVARLLPELRRLVVAVLARGATDVPGLALLGRGHHDAGCRLDVRLARGLVERGDVGLHGLAARERL